MNLIKKPTKINLKSLILLEFGDQKATLIFTIALWWLSSWASFNIMFYQNGERNGPAISLYESGRIKAQGYYRDGNPTGKGFYYFESGAIKTEFEIANGKELYHYEYTESGKRGRYRTSDGKDVVD